jgi:hypothetical protein
MVMTEDSCYLLTSHDKPDIISHNFATSFASHKQLRSLVNDLIHHTAGEIFNGTAKNY